jgi:hypothetical protein
LRRCFHAVARIHEYWEYSAEKDDANLGRNADTQPDNDQWQRDPRRGVHALTKGSKTYASFLYQPMPMPDGIATATDRK